VASYEVKAILMPSVGSGVNPSSVEGGRAHTAAPTAVSSLMQPGLLLNPMFRRYYATGVARRLGPLALRVFCRASETPMCYVDVPEDETAAGYAMMAALLCGIPDPLPTATLIRSKTLAALLRLVIRTPADAWITNSVPLRPIERD